MLARASRPEWPCARSPCTPSSTLSIIAIDHPHHDHHHQRFSVHHYASPCQWPPSQSSEWQHSPSWSSVRATIVIIMIISESGKHLQSDNHHQSDSSHHQDHQWGDLAISGWMSLKLLVTTLLAMVKKPGASTDWTVNKFRNLLFSIIYVQQILNPEL